VSLGHAIRSPAMVVPGGHGRSAADVRREVDSLLWYHTIDVAPGVATKGWWDLRHALPLLPFPDLTGKRCLDIGTWDGFYAFEMERRGAAEVVALDLADLADIDYPPEVRADPTFDPSTPSDQPRSVGFHLLHELLGSKVKWHPGSVYDVADLGLGTFDFVMLGNLLIHLRDPVRALDAVRRVVGGKLLVADELYLQTQLLSRRRPLFQLRGMGRDFQWWLANEAGMRQMLHCGGFAVEQTSRPFLLRPGSTMRPTLDPKALARRAAHYAIAKDATPGGHLQRAYLAVPRFA
jgi:tRNA (mo5U34)-methyltransferase